MINCQPTGVIHVKELNLWAHVGVLDIERLLGQQFSLDFSLWLDLDDAAESDEISSTADYSRAIEEIQVLAANLECKTIEYFSDQILNLLEKLYGPLPMKVSLTKTSPPVNGFGGVVSIERRRHFSSKSL